MRLTFQIRLPHSLSENGAFAYFQSSAEEILTDDRTFAKPTWESVVEKIEGVS